MNLSKFFFDSGLLPKRICTLSITAYVNPKCILFFLEWKKQKIVNGSGASCSMKSFKHHKSYRWALFLQQE